MRRLIVILGSAIFMASCNDSDEVKRKLPLDSSIINDTIRKDPTYSSVDTTSLIKASTKKSVRIGNQEWTTRNLDVSAYRNGDRIPQVTDPSQWAKMTTGAWCYYDNESANNIIYGKLYNWFAVNDPRGLAPVGWHIPTDSEWTTLSKFLGGESIAGDKMKAMTLWHRTSGATNESEFTGLPGGYRIDDGRFATLGTFGNWWSATKINAGTAWDRILYGGNSEASRGNDSKRFGLSVRCVRN